MSFFKRMFGPKLDGTALAQSAEKGEYAQIDLLARFVGGAPLADPKLQQRWSRVLPRSYREQIELFVRQDWLEELPDGDYAVTATAMPLVTLYNERLEQARVRVMPQVREALANRDAGEALDLRRNYEASHPLGSADWSGPEPQLSRSSLTRRILFLDHWLLDGLSPETVEWLKLYAAEQHLWDAYWRLPVDDIPPSVQQELAQGGLDVVDAVYWKAYELALLVDNQETWQRCKGGDHVRRIEVVAMDDEHTCEICRATHGQEYLVVRVPELPHRTCTSSLGCRCRYEPVLESYEDLEA